ncbi:hypothetical protein E2562_033271 [Oryza meyeriana var. granulata]|uniref:BURP domain-containing protein n=1 Tax=Oryza meyeriana var. granulata TaxID=110450 RepID=A0A6G1CW28_9ORYZ|nr:hypothetical protein E2562_033271 [Oryza meyeriana var. granulata]
MSTLLSLLSFLLMMMAGEGRNLLSAKETITMVPGPMAEVTTYWKTILPNSPIPSAILDLLTPPSGNQKKEIASLSSGVKGTDEKSSVSELNPERDQDKNKFSQYIYGTRADGDDRIHYDGHGDKHIVFNYQTVKEKLDMYWYGGANGINKKQFSRYIYGNPADGHDHVFLLKKKFSRYIYGNQVDEHDHVHYDGHSGNRMLFNNEAMKLKKKNSDLYQYKGANGIDEKLELDLASKKFSRYIYGNSADGHDHVHLPKNQLSRYIYGNPADGNDHVHRDSHREKLNEEAVKLRNDGSNLYNYGGLKEIDEKLKLDLNKKFSRYIYGNPIDGHGHVNHQAKKKFSRYIYGNPADEHDNIHLAKRKFSRYINGNTADGHDHVHRYGHDNNYMVFNEEVVKITKEIGNEPKLELANKKSARYIYGSQADEHDNRMVFREEALTPGSTLAPYIMPASARGPFLRRDVAESLPMSTKNFTDILAMFAPASLAMADDVWSTVDACEHPGHPVKGEKRACVRSIESMVELAVSLLGTRDLRAFSSPEVPEEGVGVGVAVASRRRYGVASVRAVTGSLETMTCHGMAFPHAVFYCHAINPTRSYEVTLQEKSEDDGDDRAAAAGAAGSRKAIKALAVCHLDTSEFDPSKMPADLRPGEGAACHFISRDSIIWALAADAASAADGEDGQAATANQ